MSIEALIKQTQREENERAMKEYLAKGGKITRIENTVESFEAYWRDSLPSGLKARIQRQAEKKANNTGGIHDPSSEQTDSEIRLPASHAQTRGSR